jgi:hypothetical protein
VGNLFSMGGNIVEATLLTCGFIYHRHGLIAVWYLYVGARTLLYPLVLFDASMVRLRCQSNGIQEFEKLQ